MSFHILGGGFLRNAQASGPLFLKETLDIYRSNTYVRLTRPAARRDERCLASCEDDGWREYAHMPMSGLNVVLSETPMPTKDGHNACGNCGNAPCSAQPVTRGQ